MEGAGKQCCSTRRAHSIAATACVCVEIEKSPSQWKVVGVLTCVCAVRRYPLQHGRVGGRSEGPGLSDDL